jgi:hypothetical protein
MFSPKVVIGHQFQSSQILIDKFTADLTDAEYFAVPVPGGNHAGWILGHIAATEDYLSSKLAGEALRVPQATHALFNGRSQCRPDASVYPSRAEIDRLFKDVRANTRQILEKFDDKRWGEPSPEGVPQALAPTAGAAWALMGTHPFWHIGQLTVNRTALHKPRVITG